jgi:hypothetical protein
MASETQHAEQRFMDVKKARRSLRACGERKSLSPVYLVVDKIQQTGQQLLSGASRPVFYFPRDFFCHVARPACGVLKATMRTDCYIDRP